MSDSLRLQGRPQRLMRPFLNVHALLLSATAFGLASVAGAQVSTPATPGAVNLKQEALTGPPPPISKSRGLGAHSGPLPSSLSLQLALQEAEARSPAILAALASVEAAEARIRQAGFRANPELSVEVENFFGTGDLSGFKGVETTVSVSQQLDLAGRRRTRVSAAEADLMGQQLRLSIARAELASEVRQAFARAVVAGERSALAQANEERARELARVATILVREGREPPLRGLRARAAAAQAAATVAAVKAEETAALTTLGSLFGSEVPPTSVVGDLLDLAPRTIDPGQSLEVRLAEAERVMAEAALLQETVAKRLDPAVGLGVRHVRELGDVAFVAGVSMPLPVFDRNRGAIEAARANVRAAEARRDSALAAATARARNAITNVEAASARVEALETSAIPEAAEAVRLAQLSYQAGRSPLIEVLDAQNAYSAAQAALIDARLAQALATAELGRAAAQ